MANKKLVTLEQLTRYTGKVKENLDKKLNKNGDQILDGSFTTTGDVSVQGNLHVAGSTIAVNKETLTVKDNFVAVNGNGTVLDTTKKVGLLAITGEETYKLKDGWYRFNAEAIHNKLNPQVGPRPGEPEVLIISSYDQDFLLAVNYCGLCAKLIEYAGEVKAWQTDLTFNLTYGTTFIQLTYTHENETQFPPIVDIGIDYNTMNAIYTPYDWAFKLENQIIDPKYGALVASILTRDNGEPITLEDDFEQVPKAYAAPIYDVASDSLKIGLGNFTRNTDGNIVDFKFGAGQGQSLATRSDSIEDGHLVKWDNIGNKLVDAGNLPNIENGKGEYSIVALEDNSKKNEAFGRANFSGGHKTKTYQKDTLGFGAGVISGRKEAETSITYRPRDGANIPMTIQSFNDFYWDPNYENEDGTFGAPKNGGKGLDSNGNILDNSGRTYNDSYGTCITFGQSTVNAGRAALVSGENNANEAAWAIMHGRYNWNKDNGEYSDIGGFWNTNNGAYNTMRGRFNTSYNDTFQQDFSHITLLGDGLKATNDYCTIVGINGGDKQLGSVRLLFGVATGEGNQGFEVYEGGRVRVLRAPSYDTEVARLKEITELDTKITTRIDGLNARLDTEESARAEADAVLSGRIDDLDNRLDTEKRLREDADADLDSAKKNKSDFIYENGILTIIID